MGLAPTVDSEVLATDQRRSNGSHLALILAPLSPPSSAPPLPRVSRLYRDLPHKDKYFKTTRGNLPNFIETEKAKQNMKTEEFVSLKEQDKADKKLIK